MLATLAALAFVNIGFHDAYERLIKTPAGFTWGASAFSLSLETWVNDGPDGHLHFCWLESKSNAKPSLANSPIRGALMPIIAAAGGIVVPALICLSTVPSIGAATQSEAGAFPWQLTLPLLWA